VVAGVGVQPHPWVIGFSFLRVAVVAGVGVQPHPWVIGFSFLRVAVVAGVGVQPHPWVTGFSFLRSHGQVVCVVAKHQVKSPALGHDDVRLDSAGNVESLNGDSGRRT
jgi:hypothetical protein